MILSALVIVAILVLLVVVAMVGQALRVRAKTGNWSTSLRGTLMSAVFSLVGMSLGFVVSLPLAVFALIGNRAEDVVGLTLHNPLIVIAIMMALGTLLGMRHGTKRHLEMLRRTAGSPVPAPYPPSEDVQRPE